MINKFDLDKCFEKILSRIDHRINEASGWIIESINSQYLNISIDRSLIGSSCVKSPVELRSPRKGLINIKSNDQKFFLWRHVRHINSIKIHLEWNTQKDKEFLVKFQRKTAFASMLFVMKIN